MYLLPKALICKFALVIPNRVKLLKHEYMLQAQHKHGKSISIPLTKSEQRVKAIPDNSILKYGKYPVVIPSTS